MGGQTGSAGVALVTGAGGGIGRAIARALALVGHPLALVDRDADALAAVVADVEAGDGVPVVGVRADVRVPAEVTAACALAATLGPVDTLVGAAGVYGPRVAFVDSDPDEWWQVVETNVRGAALFADAVLPSMLERRCGHIVNVSSRAAFWDDPGHSSVAYSTSKAGLTRFTGALAAEVAGTGVFVVDLGPGLVRTNMTATRPDLAELPDDAFVPAAVVADAAVALVSGRYPELHGRFVHATDDLDELVVRVGAVPHARTLGLEPSGAGDRIASAAIATRTAARR